MLKNTDLIDKMAQTVGQYQEDSSPDEHELIPPYVAVPNCFKRRKTSSEVPVSLQSSVFRQISSDLVTQTAQCNSSARLFLKVSSLLHAARTLAHGTQAVFKEMLPNNAIKERLYREASETHGTCQPQPDNGTTDPSAHTHPTSGTQEVSSSSMGSKWSRMIAESKTKILQHHWACATCGMIFHSIKDMKKHAAPTGQHPPRSQPFKCSVCTSRFLKYDSYHRHLKAHKADKTYSCEFCDRKGPDGWDRKDRLEAHMKQNHKK